MIAQDLNNGARFRVVDNVSPKVVRNETLIKLGDAIKGHDPATLAIGISSRRTYRLPLDVSVEMIDPE